MGGHNPLTKKTFGEHNVSKFMNTPETCNTNEPGTATHTKLL